jgi:hypothetical protein
MLTSPSTEGIVVRSITFAVGLVLFLWGLIAVVMIRDFRPITLYAAPITMTLLGAVLLLIWQSASRRAQGRPLEPFRPGPSP